MTNESQVAGGGLEMGKLIPAVREAARAQGFAEEIFGEVEGWPLLALTRRARIAGPEDAACDSVPDGRAPGAYRGPGSPPRIYISTGIHGDEPAGPIALLELLREGWFDRGVHWVLCPMLNPVGHTLRTRESRTGLDLNRDYRHCDSPEITAHVRWLEKQPRYDLALCLHEDWESKGFYFYELAGGADRDMCEAVLAAAGAIGPLEAAEVIDGRKAEAPGLIRPVADPVIRDRWPEAVYLWAKHTPLCLTTETPSALPLRQRVAWQRAVVDAAVGVVRRRRLKSER